MSPPARLAYTARAAIDERNRTWGEWEIGRFHFGPWGNAQTFAAGGKLGRPVVPTVYEALVTDTPPFTTDALGQSPPANTLYVCFPGATSLHASVKTAGTISGSAALHLASGWKSWLLLQVIGLPVGASGTLVIQAHTGGAVLTTLAIDYASHGASPTLEIPQFLGVDDTVDVTTTWTTQPQAAFIIDHPLNTATGWYWIPAATPAGYTARNDVDLNHGGQCPGGQAGFKRSRRVRNLTFENWRLTRQYGIQATDQIWLAGIPYSCTNVLGAQGRTTYSSSGIVFPTAFFTPPSVVGSLTGPGARFAKVTFSTTASTGGRSFTGTIVRTDTGATVYSKTCTDAQLQAGDVTTFTNELPAVAGDLVTFTVTITEPARPWAGGAFVQLKLELCRPILPLPFSVVSGNLVAQGAYLPSKTADLYTGSDCTRNDQGVTSCTPTNGACSFRPFGDSWYELTGGAGAGEDPFGHPDSRTIDRGHENRPFYAKGATVSIAKYQPSFTTIDSGGTTIDTKIGNWWGFASMTFPTPGAYRVHVRAANIYQAMRGLVVEWSIGDPTCVATDGRLVWESINEQGYVQGATQDTYAGTLKKPPADATHGYYIVDTEATGDWAGHDGEMVEWDFTGNDWHYEKPEKGSMLIGPGLLTSNDFVWFDGGTWRAGKDPAITFVINTTHESQRVSMSIGAWTAEYDNTASPKVTIDWGHV